jgi:PleD family two-component response regulator
MKEFSHYRVLLVDDARANLDILIEGLESDHKLSLALNGEMALANCRPHTAGLGAVRYQ